MSKRSPPPAGAKRWVFEQLSMPGLEPPGARKCASKAAKSGPRAGVPVHDLEVRGHHVELLKCRDCGHIPELVSIGDETPSFPWKERDRLKGGEGRGAGSGLASAEPSLPSMTEEDWDSLLDIADRIADALYPESQDDPEFEDGEYDDGELADSSEW